MRQLPGWQGHFVEVPGTRRQTAHDVHAMRILSRLLAIMPSSLFVLVTATSCHHHDHSYWCDAGTCLCSGGRDCAFSCEAPPCTITCEGQNSHCDGECANGSCSCGRDSNCSFDCLAPPCHMSCAAGSVCTGTCANGSCSCAAGASCSFACSAGPCHVTCEQDNPRCDGTCANGTCYCGPGSSCRFACADNNCKVQCAAGASCVLDCPNGGAGSSCTFNECASSTTVCPSGLAVACNAPCPASLTGN
jgi:hypothetical protein